ncbi:MAG: 50S ribosomal protein L11 methyltransferase [Bacteroidales bacterium]|nr:50S ribosomal protein L11 methyltransferase [Bacteroidales bacterium]
MKYIEYQIDINNKESDFSDILIAFLSELGFDSFSEENNVLFAYIPENIDDEKEIYAMLNNFSVTFSKNIIEQKNWNEEWEKNYDPVVIENIITIKAPFHKQNFTTKYIIEIEPKMSFGTGHHPTTELMCKLINETNFEKKSVLDIGCGTGILAIFSAIKGAIDIIAIDIEEWAAENSAENALRNNVKMQTILGDKNSIPNKQFDIIFANINLNILKQDIPDYTKFLKKNGILFLSGFFKTEIQQIKNVCKNNNLEFIQSIEKELWTACQFKKS